MIEGGRLNNGGPVGGCRLPSLTEMDDTWVGAIHQALFPTVEKLAIQVCKELLLGSLRLRDGGCDLRSRDCAPGSPAVRIPLTLMCHDFCNVFGSPIIVEATDKMISSNANVKISAHARTFARANEQTSTFASVTYRLARE